LDELIDVYVRGNPLEELPERERVLLASVAVVGREKVMVWALRVI